MIKEQQFDTRQGKEIFFFSKETRQEIGDHTANYRKLTRSSYRGMRLTAHDPPVIEVINV
jgi:hypothetical protein